MPKTLCEYSWKRGVNNGPDNLILWGLQGPTSPLFFSSIHIFSIFIFYLFQVRIFNLISTRACLSLSCIHLGSFDFHSGMYNKKSTFSWKKCKLITCSTFVKWEHLTVYLIEKNQFQEKSINSDRETARKTVEMTIYTICVSDGQ